MVTAEKRAVVEELNEKFEQAESLVLTDYIGLDVAEMTELRKKLREAGVDYKVVKNTLATIAAKNADLEEVTELFKGPTAIAFGMEDVVSPAKVLVNFAKEHDLLEIKGGFLNGQVISVEKVKSLSEVPGREELLSKVLAGMQSPISGLVNILNGNLRNLVQVLNQIKENKE
ncbi:MAG: 50S ribosomal protein L10 [Bacillota bacterium]